MEQFIQASRMEQLIQARREENIARRTNPLRGKFFYSRSLYVDAASAACTWRSRDNGSETSRRDRAFGLRLFAGGGIREKELGYIGRQCFNQAIAPTGSVETYLR